MTHLWVRAESRDNEARVGITPSGVRDLLDAGMTVTVERSTARIVPDADYADLGIAMPPAGSWRQAPDEAIIFGLKELPDDEAPLTHRHIMFGHAFKGQPAGRRLLHRFRAGGGTLLDLEYLTDEAGRRVAAFGYWAGYAGAAVCLKAWAAQRQNRLLGPVKAVPSATHLLTELQSDLVACGAHRPTAIVIGAQGRVGSGVIDLCTAMGVPTTRWDMAETASGGPFPEVLQHDLFFNCVLAAPGTPVFVPSDAPQMQRRLSVIGDIACDPESDFSPVRVYDKATTWEKPVRRVAETPPLDVMAIENLPAVLPLESSEDFAAQLLPVLRNLTAADDPVWSRAEATFRSHLAAL
jgi:saccharopine dehydrogenase (NAD+, L-lysine-forming)